MAQEYVQSLHEIGEWRVFVVGGKIISVIHTFKKSNGGWGGIPTNSFLTLDEIRRVSLLTYSQYHRSFAF